MIEVRFVSPNGVVTTLAEPGARLLDVAQGAGQPLEGTCDGQMACATCHVVIDSADFVHLSPASQDEEEMLDFARHATRHSRLACQVRIAEGLGCLTVSLPGEVR